MDIPALKRSEPEAKEDATTVKAEPKQSPKLSEVSKDTKQTNDDARLKIADLVQSKEYHLAIREKRFRPLLTFALLPKRAKKPKKKHAAEPTDQTAQKKTRKTSGRSQVVVLVVILAGIILVMDAGWLSLGFDLPFDFIKQ